MSEPVIACTLSAADLGAQAARWERLRPTAEVQRVVTQHGIELEFRDGSDIESEIRALVAVEGECCAWATWSVTHNEGKLVLVVRSTGAGISALHAMFDRSS